MTQRVLPESAAHCANTACPERQTCARWVEHGAGHAFPSLFPADAEIGDACPNRVPVESQDRL